MVVFSKQRFFVNSFDLLMRIKKFEDSRGPNKLIKIHIIDVLDMRRLFVDFSAL